MLFCCGEAGVALDGVGDDAKVASRMASAEADAAMAQAKQQAKEQAEAAKQQAKAQAQAAKQQAKQASAMAGKALRNPGSLIPRYGMNELMASLGVQMGPNADPKALIGAMMNNVNSPLALLKDPGTLQRIKQAVAQSMLPGVQDLISRQTGTKTQVNPFYDRKTQSPMIWINLRKASPIVVDREFYNISRIAGMGDHAKETEKKVESKIPPLQTSLQSPLSLAEIKSATSFVQTKFDPVMIQNGLYLSMPLRQPAQETINVAAPEDTKTIQGFADMMRKKRETKRLNDAFTGIIKRLVVEDV